MSQSLDTPRRCSAPEICMAAVEDLFLRELAQDLGPEWEKVGSYLGVTFTDIAVIKLDLPQQTENQIFRMLVRWRQKQAANVDQRSALCAALRKAGRVDLADKLQGNGQCTAAHCPPQAAYQAPEAIAVTTVTTTTTTTTNGAKDGERPTTDTLLSAGTSCPPASRPDEPPPQPRKSPHRGNLDTDGAMASGEMAAVTPSKGAAEDGPGIPPCAAHPDAASEFFCEKCQRLICRRCTEAEHKPARHPCVDNSTAAEKYRQLVRGQIPQLTSEMEHISRCRDESTKLRGVLAEKARQTKEAVRRSAAAVRAEVAAAESRLLGAIDTLESERGRTLDVYVEKADSLLRAKQGSLRAASELSTVACDGAFLGRYLEVDHGALVPSRTVFHPAARQLSYLCFAESERVGDLTLGELGLTGTWKMTGSLGRKGRGTGEFDMAKGLTAREPGQIEVADYMNKRVVVCNVDDGTFINTIPLQGVPRDIAATRSQLAVVTDADRVLIYHRNISTASICGKKKTDYRSVALRRDGTVVVGDVLKGVLTEHSRQDGTLKNTIPVKIKPFFLAVDSHRGGGCRERVIISSGYQKEVVVNDFSGNTLVQIRPVVEGAPPYICTGVACDSSGVYVAMSTGQPDGGHVHHYDAEGRYQTCVARGLQKPQGLAFTVDGHVLAVAETYSLKLFQKV